MTPSRRYVLGGGLVLLLAVAAAVLFDVLGTVFLAVTVVYLLTPLRDRLTDRGVSRWTASFLSTLAVFLGLLVVAAPLVVVLALRLQSVLAFITSIPESITLRFPGFTYVVTLAEVQTALGGLVTAFATATARATPVLLVKLTLFAFVVFSLLVHSTAVRQGVLAVVPPPYRDVAKRLDERTRETLFAIYVLQAATAAGTFAIALPLFAALGYRTPIALAVVAAVLQFIPVVGPSLLLVALAAYHLVLGQPVAAALVFLVGGALVAWLPDILIRPRLARETADLSGGLYFIGFVGGLLSLGPIGIIAGPLVVALIDEMASLLASELNDIRVDED